MSNLLLSILFTRFTSTFSAPPCASEGMKNNIFIIGQQPLEEIREFLDVPYEDVPIEIVQNYTVEAWMERFFLNG